MRILVVDDDTRLTAALQRGLQADGFAVDLAADGPDGLWLAAEVDYDAIVCDVLLPGLDGFDVCGRLRDSGCWTPVALSARQLSLLEPDGAWTCQLGAMSTNRE